MKMNYLKVKFIVYKYLMKGLITYPVRSKSALQQYVKKDSSTKVSQFREGFKVLTKDNKYATHVETELTRF